MSILLVVAGILLSRPGQAQSQTSRIGMNPPRLVVLISVDQFRGDYVERYEQYLLPARSGGKMGGFRFLMETGAHFRNAMHNHIPTATGPGHATLMSGSEPAFDGIPGNEWFDRKTGKTVYCVDDPSVTPVGAQVGPMSPRNLLVTTVGDELKMATNGRSKVVGVAVKDRAVILMAGHAADAAVWYDSNTSNWVTSSWYAPDKRLPAWAERFNESKYADRFAGLAWEPLLPDDDYAITRRAQAEKPSENGKPFSHKMGAKATKSLYQGILTSTFGNEMTFAMAERAVEGEKLGQHDVPDVLVINLSSNDYVGHRFGPNSPEVMDMTVRTDRLLSEFMNRLDKFVPGGIDNVAMIVTGDHGVTPIPAESNDVYKTGVISDVGTGVVSAVRGALNQAYGDGTWVLGDGIYEQKLYLNRQLAADRGRKMADVEATAVKAAESAPGVFAAYSRTQILTNQIPPYAWRERLVNGFNARIGGDVMVLEAPGDYMDGGTGTGHQAVWDYDAHVPIFFRARGIKPGIYLKRVHTSDIAPTICRLLGIESPSGNVGVPLVDTLDKTP